MADVLADLLNTTIQVFAVSSMLAVGLRYTRGRSWTHYAHGGRARAGGELRISPLLAYAVFSSPGCLFAQVRGPGIDPGRGKEFASAGITVNAYCPGVVGTDMWVEIEPAHGRDHGSPDRRELQACFDRIDHEWLLDHIPLEKSLLRKW